MAVIQDTSAQDVVLGGASKNRKIAMYLIATILGLGGLAAYVYPSVSEMMLSDKVLSASGMRVATVNVGDLVREVNAQGHIVAANSPTLFSPEPGFVSLEIKAGDRVQKGQLLATIESPSLNERLAQAMSLYSRIQIEAERKAIKAKQLVLELQQTEDMAKVNLKAMRREQKRADRAREFQLISEFDLEKAHDDFARATLAYQQSKQNNRLEKESIEFELSSAQLDVENQDIVVQALNRRVANLVITSPVDGMIGNVQVEQRQALVDNQAIITVIDLQAFELESRVAEGFADELAPGMTAKVRVNSDIFDGEIAAISPEVVNGQVVVRIAFVGASPENLRQNQRLTSRILLQNVTDVLIVDRGPFFDTFRGDVFKVEGQIARRVAVKLGETSLRHMEVSSGLKAGDQIIISSLDVKATDLQILISE